MDQADDEKWIALLPIIFNTYDQRVMKNVDELGLFLGAQTSQSVTKPSCHSDKISKDCIMVLLCKNKGGSDR